MQTVDVNEGKKVKDIEDIQFLQYAYEYSIDADPSLRKTKEKRRINGVGLVTAFIPLVNTLNYGSPVQTVKSEDYDKNVKKGK